MLSIVRDVVESGCAADPISASGPLPVSALHPTAITPRSVATLPTIPLAIERVFMVICPCGSPCFA
jgi:hypothetical protein